MTELSYLKRMDIQDFYRIETEEKFVRAIYHASEDSKDKGADKGDGDDDESNAEDEETVERKDDEEEKNPCSEEDKNNEAIGDNIHSDESWKKTDEKQLEED
ncbi:uncharacterized protein LOC127256084 [Andrographis paniculata]|uniref:uncharacterized protein LOC127256084 n=1 Tax=Andrographis paniculata TaxID=175694 RepID=UPI0021E7819A|nr:uncharacterized protein LOC127256084 [Andrographis paniculata]